MLTITNDNKITLTKGDSMTLTVKIFGDVYRVKRGTSQTRIFYRDAIDILNNGI